MNPPPGGLVLLARIAKTHGLRGEFRAVPVSGESVNFSSLKTVYIRIEGGPAQPFGMERARPEKGSFIVKLRGVDSIEQAQTLAGAEILGAPSDFAPLPDGEFYWFQLVGLRVVAFGGTDLGVVSGLFPTGSNDVLVVVQDGRERFIPYTDDAVAKVDLARGLIHLSDLEGLEDL